MDLPAVVGELLDALDSGFELERRRPDGWARSATGVKNSLSGAAGMPRRPASGERRKDSWKTLPAYLTEQRSKVSLRAPTTTGSQKWRMARSVWPVRLSQEAKLSVSSAG